MYDKTTANDETLQLIEIDDRSIPCGDEPTDCEIIRRWADAAGIAGAYAPGEIAKELIGIYQGRVGCEFPGWPMILEAVGRGYDRAVRKAGEGYPTPRGLEIEIGGRGVELIWRTSQTLTLRLHRFVRAEFKGDPGHDRASTLIKGLQRTAYGHWERIDDEST